MMILLDQSDKVSFFSHPLKRLPTGPVRDLHMLDSQGVPNRDKGEDGLRWGKVLTVVAAASAAGLYGLRRYVE